MGYRMDEQGRQQLAVAMQRLQEAKPYRLVLSRPRPDNSLYLKITIEQKQGGTYMATCFDGKQVFHTHYQPELLWEYVKEQLSVGFERCNAWNEKKELFVSITKKGKVLVGESKSVTAPKHIESHNREKRYVLSEAEPIPALVEMGIFSRDGRLIKAMSDKFRQINRFLEMVADVVKDWPKRQPLHIVDFGCGKSYLTFVLYHFLHQQMGLDVHMTGLDLKEAVIEKCNRTAKTYGYQNLRFEVGRIEGYESERLVDMMVSLHACDTATDAALWQAMRWGCRYIFSVPCCQHELNANIAHEELAPLLEYGLIRDRMATLLTDTIRAKLLEAAGYEVQVLEFIDLAHTPKNVLLRCRKRKPGMEKRKQALQWVEQTLAQFHTTQCLYQLSHQWIREQCP